MYDHAAFDIARAEMDYRRDRIRVGLTGKARRRRPGIPRSRLPENGTQDRG